VRRKISLHDKVNPPPLEVDDGLNEEELFRKAMAEVEPLPPYPRRVPGALRTPGARAGYHQEEDRDVFLRALDAAEAIEVHYLNEYIEGGSQAWDHRLVKKLRDGGFSIQANLDLHGFSRDEAIAALERFIHDSCMKNLKCVRVIHGKGNNSRHNIPVLKQTIERWLSRRTSSRFVVAFTSARPADGGGGATYVLLRRPSGRNGVRPPGHRV